MFWLGLGLPISFVAGYTGATIPTQWPLLSVALGWLFWLRGEWSDLSPVALAFLGYAALSLAWAIHPLDSGYGLWIGAIWLLSFWFGSVAASLNSLWRGLAVGLSISSAIAVMQAAGWQAIPSADYPAGLLYNGAVQGAMIALVIVALVCQRDWFFIPSLLPGLWLSHSRGGLLILGVGLAVRYLHWSLVVGAVAMSAALAFLFFEPSDVQRLQVWSSVIAGLAPFGHGIGSTIDLAFQTHQGLFHGDVHNDYLQLTFELGIGAIPVYLAFIAALLHQDLPCWPVFVGFAISAFFFFPLHCAPLAFVGCAVAGHLLRDPDRDGVFGVDRRPDFLSRLSDAQRLYDAIRRRALSNPS